MVYFILDMIQDVHLHHHSLSASVPISADYTFALCQDSHPTPPLSSLSRSCVAVSHWCGSFFPIRIWQRHLNRLFVISHTNAGVSCLSDKTLLIFGCQKLWISLKGKIASAGMHLPCLMEKVKHYHMFPARHWTLRRCGPSNNILITDGFLQYACSKRKTCRLTEWSYHQGHRKVLALTFNFTSYSGLRGLGGIWAGAGKSKRP